jgi:predicted dehydrogenase
MDSGGSIPEALLDAVDMVYISSPNRYHASQIMQALSAGKLVVVEKTLGTTEPEFTKVIDFINDHGFKDNVYLHLHYISKSIVSELSGLIAGFSRKHGAISSFRAVFWEEANEIDKKRADWLFDQDNGGVFMDMTQPYEILFHGAAAGEVHLKEVQPYIVNPEYSRDYPTGVDATAVVSGVNFEPGAQGAIRIGKGFSKGYGEKKMEFTFKDGTIFYLSFVSYESERNKVQMPYWELISKAGGKEEVLDFGKPDGSSDSGERTLISSMVKLYEGKGADLNMDEALKIFSTQWEYQKLVKGIKPEELKYRD